MIKFKFAISSESKVVDKSGEIHQNGFSSFKLIPTGRGFSFSDKFNEYYDTRISDVVTELTNINNEATDIKNTVIDLSTNLTTNYLSEAELFDSATIGLISSSIAESTATFVTTEQAGQWYGLELTTDVNGKKYITGFDIGAIVNPSAGTSDSYFRINADRFIVGGDLGDGAFSSMVDINGDPIPAFSIVQNGTNPPEMYFNGKVNISSIPTTITKMLGNFANATALNLYLQDNPDIEVNNGDTYLNTTQDILYFWDGDEWLSSGDIVKFKSTVFIRYNSKPSTPSGGTYESPLPTSLPAWSDGVPDGTGPIWTSTTVFDNKTDYTTQPIVWSEPFPLAVSESIRILFSSAITTPSTPGDWVVNGDGTYKDSTNSWFNPMIDPVWMAMSESKIEGNTVQWSPWVVSKVKGENGLDGEQGPAGVRGTVMARINSTTNNINYYTTTAGKSALTAAVYALVTPDSLINGDQVIVTATDGTEIFQYNGSVWGTNTALKINGNAVIDGTLFASKIASNQIDATKLTVDALDGKSASFIGSRGFADGGSWAIGVVGVSAGGLHAEGKSNWGVVGKSSSSAGGVLGYTTTGAPGVKGQSSSWAVWGETTEASGQWGFYTADKAYAAGGFFPFTGSHIVYSSTDIDVGDIVVSIDAWSVDYNNSLIHVAKANTSCDKRVLGVVSYMSNDLTKNLYNNKLICDIKETDKVGTYEYSIKKEYAPYIINMIDGGYKEILVNALGEGSINVCNKNGSIENGDYICSSTVDGKGELQVDDTLHNYTVAKALESVIWENEMIGINGCFEFKGYKCKRIACTYHCG